MKSIAIALVSSLITIFPLVGYAQDPTLAQLNRQVVSLYRQGKLDDAIILAEKIADKGKSDKSYPILLANVAQLRKKRIQSTEAERAATATTAERFETLIKTAHDDCDEAENNYRKALKAAESPATRVDQIALWKTELAWVLYYRLSGMPPKKEFAELGEAKATVKETEMLYTQALSEFESSLGPSAPATLSAAFGLAEFYRNEAEFENAVGLYRRVIASFEANPHSDKVIHVYALRMLFSIYVMAGMSAEADELTARISAISGQKEVTPVTKYNLSFRSGDYRPPTTQKLGGMRPISGQYSGADSSKGFLLGGKKSPSTQGDILSAAVEVSVDETGNVTAAKSTLADKFLNTTAETGVMKWRFRPLVIDGKPRRMSGYIVYAFRR